MHLITNLRIRARLFLSFGLMLILIAVMGLNGLISIRNIQGSFEEFYNDRFVSNMLLGKIQVNQEKARTEIQRILYKSEAMQDRAVIRTSEEALNEFIAENDLLLQEYEAKGLSPEEEELLAQLKIANSSYRYAREEVIAAVKNGNFDLAVQINDEKARALRDEVSTILDQMKELNDKIGAEQMEAAKAELIRTRNISFILLAVAILASLGLSWRLNKSIAGPIQTLVEHAHHMAGGDFTREVPGNLQRRKDEMGMIVSAFAEMSNTIRGMLQEVSALVEQASASSEELSATTEEVSAQGENIAASVQQISAGMEEINASVEEVSMASSQIVGKAQEMEKEVVESEQKIDEIRKRAEEMKDSAHLSRQAAKEIYTLRQKEITAAIDRVGVVEEITKMADVISEIAEQTNLLALNAAIEAARAGEQGRGFAVVAEEVRKLAEHSATTAGDIHQVIRQVKEAVDQLTSNAEEILKFLDEKVTSDYDMLEETAEQYAEDAHFIKNLINDFYTVVAQIVTSIEQIGKSIEGVAATVEEAAASSEEISSSAEETTKALAEVAQTAQSQAKAAETLSTMVANFKV